MVTLAQAQERAERWINEDVPAYQQRDARVREFALGFVCWAEPRDGGPTADGAHTRLVIARDSGDTTLWPGLPTGEVIRRYEEEYGAAAVTGHSAPPPPGGADLEATSFLLTPPEWLQDAADQAAGQSDDRSDGVSDGRTPAVPAPREEDKANPWDAADTTDAGTGQAQQPPVTVFAPPLVADDEQPAHPEPAPAPEAPAAPPAPAHEAGAAGGYVPTRLVSADDVMASAPPPQAPPSAPPAPEATGGTDPHHAATVLAGPAPLGPGVPPPPPPPPTAPGPPMPQAPQAPQAPHAGYGYPQAPPPGVPVVGSGYMAVLRYRAPDGSEQQLIRRSSPGLPHPEWQILHELRAMNVPPQQVLELHTELESCDLPGGYCARMIRENWPQVRVSHTAAYGRDHASRQQGMRHLVEHQGELHQVADAPPRHAPRPAPLPPPHQIQPVPPAPPQAVGQELLQAFGPQGVFRFDQHAVSRQGVPDVVAQTLVWAGVPVEATPFFRGQVQPGRPLPTLAELAREHGLQPAPDAGSYLVVGNDFGRRICVQYGTAHIVALPLEATPGAAPGTPQFVNTGLPEFVRSLALLGRMWPLRYGLTHEQAGRWTVDFQLQLAALDAAALSSPENWWSVLLEQMWDGLF
jgi:SUKH-4 immunity protein of toxin-antitoxin system/nucleic acid/nucleotide deaminase of polymorphic system toxin